MGDYEGYNKYLALLYQVFRNGIGDIALFQTPDDSTFNKWMVTITTWIQIFIMIIVFLNFLIAEVSATYERISSSKDLIQYKQKRQLNQEFYLF